MLEWKRWWSMSGLRARVTDRRGCVHVYVMSLRCNVSQRRCCGVTEPSLSTSVEHDPNIATNWAMLVWVTFRTCYSYSRMRELELREPKQWTSKTVLLAAAEHFFFNFFSRLAQRVARAARQAQRAARAARLTHFPCPEWNTHQNLHCCLPSWCVQKRQYKSPPWDTSA